MSSNIYAGVKIPKSLVDASVSDFKDLSKESQKSILDLDVIFQGHNVKLSSLLSEDYAQTFDARQMSELLGRETCHIGQKLMIPATYKHSSYIVSSFNRQVPILDVSDVENMPDTKIVTSREKFLEESQKSKQIIHYVAPIEKSKLMWKQTSGDISKIRPYVDYFCNVSSPWENMMKDNRVIIISADGGMGKTTFFTYLYVIFREQFRSKWVCKFELNDYRNEVREAHTNRVDFTQLSNVINFISNKLLKLTKSLEKALFEQSFFAEGTLILLFDGIDELNPLYVGMLTTLFRTLSNSHIELLGITTRKHLQLGLEDQLSTFAYTFNSFTSANQIEFFRNYWKDSAAISDDMSEKYMQLLMDEIYIKPRSGRKMMSKVTPLQMNMIAEIIGPNSAKPMLHKNSTLLDLYRVFLDVKMNCPADERTDINNLHYRLAVQIVFNKKIDVEQVRRPRSRKFIDVLGCSSDKKPNEDLDDDWEEAESALKYGIVHRESNSSSYHFLHRSFGEYFVADYLMNSEINNYKTISDFNKNLLIEVMSSPSYQMTRYFIDEMLLVNSDTKKKFTVYNKIAKEIGRYERKNSTNKNVLKKSIAENNSEIFKIILKHHIQEFAEDQVTDIIFELIPITIMYLNTDAIAIVMKIIEINKLYKKVLKGLVTGRYPKPDSKSGVKISMIELLLTNEVGEEYELEKRKEMMHELLAIFKKIDSKKVMKNDDDWTNLLQNTGRMDYLKLGIYNMNFEVVKILLDFMQLRFKKEFDYTVTCTINSMNCLHTITNCLLLRSCDKYDRDMLLEQVDAFTNWFINIHIEDEDKLKLLLQEAQTYQLNALEMMAKNELLDVLPKYLSLLKKLITSVREKQPENYETTYMTVLARLLYQFDTKESMSFYVSWLKHSCDRDIIIKILTHKIDNTLMPLQYMSLWNKLEPLEVLQSLTNEIVNTKAELITVTGVSDAAVTAILKNKDIDIKDKVIEVIRAVCAASTSSAFGDMLSQKLLQIDDATVLDRHREGILIKAIRKNRKAAEFYSSWILEQKQPDLVTRYFRNALQITHFEHIDDLSLLLNLIESLKDVNVICNFFLVIDIEGDTVFNYAVKSSNFECIHKILEMTDLYADADTFGEMLKRNLHGSSVLWNFFQYRSHDTNRKLFDLMLKKNVSQSTIMEIFSYVDESGGNFIHNAIHCECDKKTRMLIDFMLATLDRPSIKQLLQYKNLTRETPIEVAARIGNERTWGLWKSLNLDATESG